MNRLTILLICWTLALAASAQTKYYETRGTVRDAETREVLSGVDVRDTVEHVSTVTNADGSFVLKTRHKPSALRLSHVGYTPSMPDCSAIVDAPLRIALRREAVSLPEVTVLLQDPKSLLQEAIAKIPVNYAQRPELLKGFYRETTQRRRKFIYVAEALTDVYKNSYSKGTARDAVAITKARRLISTHAKDTLGAKMQGGPSLATQLDLVRHFEDLLSDEMLEHYRLTIGLPETTEGRRQIVVEMEPYARQENAFYYARIWIDTGTLAFTRFELSLDMRDKTLAGRFMLLHKPRGVRFKPIEMTLTASYGTEDGVTRLRYVKSHSRFQCDWKRKWFHSTYDVISEMAITGRYPEPEVHPIARRDAFPKTSSLYDRAELFEAPDFWGSENIIAPSESLEKGIGKLKKRSMESNASDMKRRPFDATAPLVHDPVLARCDSTYYLFGTGMHIDRMKSSDLKTWEPMEPVMESTPQWAKDTVPGYRGHTWAPDIRKAGNTWYLYYSCSTFGKNLSAIGLMTNKTLDPASPDYKWEDQGLVVKSTPGQTDWNAIDPCLIVDEHGTPWLTWGSFWDGIQLVELSSDFRTPAGTPRTIARRRHKNHLTDSLTNEDQARAKEAPEAGVNAIEAPFIIYRDGWYYLFVSWDYCCKGPNSNYKTAVGRSRTVNGPYLDRSGRDMSEGGGNLIAGPSEAYYGIGHCSAYEFDGQWYFIAHGYSAADGGMSRLTVRQMNFDAEGWPVVGF